MKTFALILIAAASFAFAPLAQAEDAKPAGTPAACCKKAAAADKACTHGCCTEAAKTAKNCEKCGGKNEASSEKVS
jgi:hypothetical protein